MYRALEIAVVEAVPDGLVVVVAGTPMPEACVVVISSVRPASSRRNSFNSIATSLIV